jgi:hypothetical protein
MKPVTSSTCQTPAKVITFYLPEKNNYSLAKTVRCLIEAIPMGEGTLQLRVTSNTKCVEKFVLDSAHLRGQFFNTMKTSYFEDKLSKGCSIELVINTKKMQ